ncbi:tail fiber [Pelagibacter phage Jormungand EXVC012P]|nr:tail fiber [Pelagibacter phage Jormungand EXVC012P]QLF88510.1 tail fiber [Pelagibacter phage Ran EXVC014P]
MANSFVRYTGDNSTTAYSIPFSYRATGDLTVTISGSATTAFTLNAAGTTLTFNSAPAQGAAIEIRRKTSQGTKLVDYASGSVLTENDLDTDSEQAFFMSQESIDDANDVIKISNVDFQYDATNKQIRNVTDPTSAQDVATKNYLENTWLTPANKTALTTVNSNIANINAVNSNASNINSAVSNETNINTVATNIGSVNTVATDISKVIAVANDLAEAVSEVETVADDLNEATSEIDTVSNNIANVNTVGTNIANVNTVAGINSDVSTVAGISSDITTVRGINSAISNVSGISSDVTAVNSNSSNINTVAGNNANVSTVAGISGNVTTVAGISSDVTSVANDATDIGTVAGISSDVTSVAGISSAVSAVNSNSSNINAVNSNSANINTVAGNNTNINTVAGVSSDVTTVAGISSDVQAVENIASNVTTVAGMSTAINTANSNSSNINTVAGAITNVNNVGGSIANVNTVATNLASVNAFGETYRIASSAPTTSLNSGDLYFNTSTNVLNVYGASGWQNAGSSVNGTSQRYNYTATNAQTTFTGSDNNGNTLAYDAGYIDVYLNGSKLLNGTDVTVTSGSSVVLASGATTGDVVDIVAYGTFSVASLNADNLTSGTVPDARITGAYTGITGLGTLSSLNVDASAGTGVIGITLDNGTVTTSKDSSSFRSQLSMYNTTGQVAKFDTASDDLFLRFADDLAFQSIAGSEYMRINSSGNLGIGTSSPQEKLQINATASSFLQLTNNDTGTADNNGLYVGVISGGNAYVGLRDTNGNDLIFQTENTERMRIDSSGNVGIGTSSPSTRLDVNLSGSGETVPIVLSNRDTTAGTGQKTTLGFGLARNSGAFKSQAGTIEVGREQDWTSADANIDSYMAFSTYLNNAGTEKMRIDSSGNLLVGKTSTSRPVAGAELRSTGFARFTVDQSNPLELVRTTNDGEVIKFYKDNTHVGSIGLTSSGINIALGGTGTANTLDDYEEGTWTPTVNTASGFSTGATNYSGTSAPRYTKIGNRVFLQCQVQMGNSSGNVALDDSITMTGLPFTPADIERNTVTEYRYNNNVAYMTSFLQASGAIFSVVRFLKGTPLRNGGAINININYTV